MMWKHGGLALAVLSVKVLLLQSAADDSVLLTRIDDRVDFELATFQGTYESLPAGFSVSKDGCTSMETGDADFRGCSSGNVTTGGCYAWVLDRVRRAVGYQPTADEFTPGYIMASVSNATGTLVHSLVIRYDVVYLNNADRSSRLDFEYSIDEVAFAQVASVSLVTPAPRDTNSVWIVCPRKVRIDLAPERRALGRVRRRWMGNDEGGSGSRDEYGLMNISVKACWSDGTVLWLK